MVKLRKLISQTRNTETNAVAIRIVGTYKKGNWEDDVHLTLIITSLVTLSARLTTAINRGKSESHLEQKNEDRDVQIRAIHYILLGALHHPDSGVCYKAQIVNSVFARYGLAMIGQNYAAETSLVESLLEDLEAANVKAAISSISGLTEVIAALQIAQINFEQTRIAYEADKAEEGKLEIATQVKNEMRKLINDQLMVYLAAMIQVDETKYGDFTRTIATIIDDNNEMVKKRIKKDIK